MNHNTHLSCIAVEGKAEMDRCTVVQGKTYGPIDESQRCFKYVGSGRCYISREEEETSWESLTIR